MIHVDYMLNVFRSVRWSGKTPTSGGTEAEFTESATESALSYKRIL